MGIRRWLHSVTEQKVSIVPLVTFRVLFGLVLLTSIIRFWANGWIEAQYIMPELHFKYFGFYWLPEPSALGYYAIFGIMALSALGIALGAAYRLSAITFFLSFTYIELIDITYYLNHYYFVSLVALVLIFLPANRKYSLDVLMGWTKPTDHVRAWNINLIKFQLGLVYFLAGVAKINADWLLEAMPLALWLPAQDHLPIIGPLFGFKATAYAFSWAGMLYDLSVPFLLLWSRTRVLAYGAVIVFHMLTWSLFQIGMFPFIMIGATLIFFSAKWHERLWGALSKWKKRKATFRQTQSDRLGTGKWKKQLGYSVLALFILFQATFPFRYLLYPGNPYWHEQGYRFGWRVMLMEKAGYAQFQVVDDQERIIEVENRDFLTIAQEKMMSTQPDLMLQYAHFLKEHYTGEGVEAEDVRAKVHVTFNGRPSRPYIDPTVDLASIQDSWEPKTWILPFNERGS